MVKVVAEISSNHGNKFEIGKELIEIAADAGADVVKFQAYTADTMTLNIDGPMFRVNHPKWGSQSLYDLYSEASTPWEWIKEFKKIADDNGLLFLCTSFDKSSVDFLESLGVYSHKIASFELNDLPLIQHAASTHKPLILSTGMASLCEITEAVEAARSGGAIDITLLRCVSAYPASPSDIHLQTIPCLSETFGCKVGLSDHTLGVGVSIGAVALGASMVEKHFTLDRNIETPDAFFSVEPKELKYLVENIRIVSEAIGEIKFNNKGQMHSLRRSIFVSEDIKEGEVFADENIKCIRPAFGLPPKYYPLVIGRCASTNIARGTPLSWELVGEFSQKQS